MRRRCGRLEIAGTPYRPCPVVYISKLKRVAKFPYRSNSGLVFESVDHVDFDESLLPEDSWEIELDADKYEVEVISDVRSGRTTRSSRMDKQYMVRWKEHKDLTCMRIVA